MLERVDQCVLGHPSSDHPLPLPELPLLCADNTHLNLSTNPSLQSFGNRAFSVAASTCWNSLPAESLDAASVVTFKSSFKPLLTSSYLMVPSWQSLPQLFSILCAMYLFCLPVLCPLVNWKALCGCNYYYFLLVLFYFLQNGTLETFHWGVIDENYLSLYFLGSVFPLNFFVFFFCGQIFWKVGGRIPIKKLPFMVGYSHIMGIMSYFG